MSTIVLTESQWKNISAKLYKDRSPAIHIATVHKREFGFTVRRHVYIVKVDFDVGQYNDYEYVEGIHLDFYDEACATMFRLKYL